MLCEDRDIVVADDGWQWYAVQSELRVEEERTMYVVEMSRPGSAGLLVYNIPAERVHQSVGNRLEDIG